MVQTIHKKFIAALSVAAICVTAIGAGPARAGDYDTERALAAILGLAVIGAIIADNKRDDRAVTRNRPYRVEPRPLPRRAHRANVLPEQCLRRIETDTGRTARILGQRCMQRHYAYTDSLPDRCERRVYSANGKLRRGWSARCLNRQGYQLSRR